MADGRRDARGEAGMGWRRWLLIICLALLVIFFLANSQSVTVHFLIGTVDMPLIVALAIAALLGALVGWAVPRLRSRE